MTDSLSNPLTIVTVTAVAVALAAAGCGMRPPPDFHEAADVDNVDLDPLPDKPAEPAPGDGGVAPDGGTTADLPEDRAELPVAVGMAAVPAIPVSAILGKTREEVESLIDPIGPDDEEQPEGWIRYSDHLKLLFVEEAVSELIQEIPEGKTCLEAALWLGFTAAKEPVQAADACRWPDNDAEHALGDGVGGELPLKTHLFRAWVKQ
jgi:hypothetical protein